MKKLLLLGCIFFSLIAYGQHPLDSLESFMNLEIPRVTIVKQGIKKITYTNLPKPNSDLEELNDEVIIEFDAYGYPTKRMGGEGKYGNIKYKNTYAEDGRLLLKVIANGQDMLGDTLTYDATNNWVKLNDAEVFYDSLGRIDTIENNFWRSYCNYASNGKIDAIGREYMIHDMCGAVGIRLYADFDKKGRMIQIQNDGFGPFFRAEYTCKYKKNVLKSIDADVENIMNGESTIYTFEYFYNDKKLPTQVKIINTETDEVLLVGYQYEFY